METKWTTAIQNMPQPEPGTLTERALPQAPQKAHRGLRPYAYGSLALAATLPVAFLLLPKPSTQPEPDPPVALRFAKQSLSLQKRPSEEVRAVLQPKVALSYQTPLPKQNTTQKFSLSVTPNKEKATLPRSRPLAESKTTTYEFQERAVLKESAQANEELLLRLARGGVASRGLSVSSLSSGSKARGTQVGLVVNERLAEIEGTLLTPLPNAPTYENPKLKTTLLRQSDGSVEGTLVLATPTRGGLIPKAYLVYIAAFDAKGTLVSTAQTELPGVGGTATVKFGLAPTAQHYQLALFAKPNPPQDELIVAGYLVRHFEGKVPLPLTGTYGENTFNLVTFSEPHFMQSNYYKTVSANLTVSVASLSDAAGYTVHGALFDEKGALLSTDQAPLKPLTLTVGTPLQAQHSQTIGLGFGVTGQSATRYQLAVTAPKPTPSNVRLGEYRVAQAVPENLTRGQWAALAPEPQTARGGIALGRNPFNLNLNLSSLSTLSEIPSEAPDASMIVASVKTEENGSLLLLPPPCPNSMEEIFKNPKLRDYTQIKLASSVVAALKTKGITEFVGKSVQASGKSESSLYLARPAFEVTTVTVEKAEDVQVGLPLFKFLLTDPPKPIQVRLPITLTAPEPSQTLKLIEPLQALFYLQQLRAAKDHQARYELLISPEFNETLLAAAQRGDEATVIELVQWSWFGGPSEAIKGGNTGLHRTYRPEIAELLIKHKAPIEAKNNDGETPLIAQTRQADRWLGRLGVVQALLRAGANPNATDNHGRTPLMWAAKSGVPDFVEALLKNGANPKLKDKDGKTARDYIAAWQWGNTPGFLTIERAAQLQHDAEADRARVGKLLGER